MPVLTSSRVPILTPRSFEPPHLGGCVLWLAADRIQGQSDGGTVGVWTDYSGRGNNTSQVGTGAVYRANILNGYPAVQGRDTALDYLNVGDLSSLFSASVGSFVVCVTHNDTSNTGVLTCGADSVDSYWRYAPTGNAYFGVLRSSRLEATPTGMPTSGSNVWSVVSGANYNIYKDGVNVASTTTAWQSPTSVKLFIEGLTAPSVKPGNDYIHELAIFDRALSNGDLNRFHTYLRQKYNLSISAL